MGMTQSRIKSSIRIKCFSLESWVELNRKMGKHFERWVNLNQYLRNPLESWVDSESIPGKRLESWVESIQVFEILLESLADTNQGIWRMPPKNQRNLAKSPKNVNEISEIPKTLTKLCESPKKVNAINSWFQSLSHDLIRINIPEFLWVMSWFESTFWIFFSREMIRIKIFWKPFES